MGWEGSSRHDPLPPSPCPCSGCLAGAGEGVWTSAFGQERGMQRGHEDGWTGLRGLLLALGPHLMSTCISHAAKRQKSLGCLFVPTTPPCVFPGGWRWGLVGNRPEPFSRRSRGRDPGSHSRLVPLCCYFNAGLLVSKLNRCSLSPESCVPSVPWVWFAKHRTAGWGP